MDKKTLSRAQLLNFRLVDSLINERKWSQDMFNNDLAWNILNAQDINAKTSVILIRTNNDPEIEWEFRKTCSFYESQHSVSDLSLIQAYQEYVNAYRHFTSLYFIENTYDLAVLTTFDTESKTKKTKVLGNISIGKGACIAQLPNNEIFCLGSNVYIESVLIIDSGYRIRFLPPGSPRKYSSAIYYNKNVYCFGGRKKSHKVTHSSRFDLDQNRWIKLAGLPNDDFLNHSVIFNGNILISGYYSKNILIYSIDLESFSTISYDFKQNNGKILISTERLYLISQEKIYQSKIGDEYAWEIVRKSNTGITYYHFYCAYNKGDVYIGIFESMDIKYFKFNLKKKSWSKL